jgi:imidazolonepropionase-like amidohydrolase
MPSRRRLTAGLALAACLAGRAASEEPEGPVLVLVGGEVRSAAGPVVRGGTVLVRGGRIEAVGADVNVPDGARRIDVTGAVVTPGFVDADGALPIPVEERFAPRWGVDLRAADAVDADDPRLATARRQGVTSFLVTGDARGNFAATAALVANSSPAAVLDADGPLVVTLATPDVAGGVWGAQRLAEVRGVYVDARERREALARWRRDLQRYEERRAAEAPIAVERLLLPSDLVEEMSRWPPERRAAWREAALKSAGREKDWTRPKDLARPPLRPVRDPALDLVIATMDAASGRRTLVRTQTAADVRAALALAKEFGLSVTVTGGEGLAEDAEELAAAKVPVVVGDAADTAFRAEGPLAARRPGLAARLVAAGLHPAIASGGAGGGARFLRLLAAREIGEGLAPDDALRAVTAWAAEAAGAADKVGSLAPGRRADVVVWDGDPFAAASRPRLVLVGGAVVEGGR